MTAEFDAHAGDYAAQVERSIAFSGLSHDYFLEAKAALLADVFTAHFGDRRPHLLDVGCGVGSLHGFLHPIVGRLAGCDVSAEALARASRAYPQVEYRRSDDAALPFGQDFDVCLAVCVFHHVRKSERLALLSQMRRVTRRGGLVVVIEHNPFNPGTRLAVSRCAFDRHADLLSAGETAGLFRAAGLEAVGSRHFLLLPFRVAPALWVERRLERLPFGAQFATVGCER